jgi:hypothetical protein
MTRSPQTLAEVDPNGIYTLAEMAAVVRRCTKTLRNHCVPLLGKFARNSPCMVTGHTILAYLKNPRPTENARQRSKRADATMKAATAGL